jgi:hypothetical protein
MLKKGAIGVGGLGETSCVRPWTSSVEISSGFSPLRPLFDDEPERANPRKKTAKDTMTLELFGRNAMINFAGPAKGSQAACSDIRNAYPYL